MSARGFEVIVATYDEALYGVVPDVPSGTRLHYNNFGVQPKQAVVEDETIFAGRGPRRPAAGNLDVGGTLSCNLAPGGQDFWLRHLLGAPTGAGLPGSPSIYTPTGMPAGFILERDWRSAIPGKVERFSGCRFASGTFSFSQEGFLNLSAEVVGRGYQIDTAPLDATLTIPSHEAWQGIHGRMSIANVAQPGILSGSLKIDNDLDSSLYAFAVGLEQQGRRAALPEGKAKVTGQFEMLFDAGALGLIERALTGTPVTLTWQYERANVGALKFLVTDALIKLGAPPIETPAGIKVTLELVAFQSGSHLGLRVLWEPWSDELSYGMAFIGPGVDYFLVANDRLVCGSDRITAGAS